MNKEQQIEKMIPIIKAVIFENALNVDVGKECDTFLIDGNDIDHSAEDSATALYEAGYRKQSDTVREFAEKLTLAIHDKEYKAGFSAHMLWAADAVKIVTGLAEKYGAEVE